MKNTARTVLAGAVLCATSALALQASAALVERSTFSHAAANCQSALPIFDGNIRKRPKALANEGTSNAFVTCAFEAANEATASITRVEVIALNRGSVAKDLSCTLVNGFRDFDYSPSSTKTVSMAPGAAGRTSWAVSADNAGNNYNFPAVSCNLQPQVEISGTTIRFTEDIGS